MCKEQFGWIKNNLCFSLLEYIVVITLVFSGIQFCCLGKSMPICFSFLLNDFNILHAYVHAKSLQSSPTLCDPMDGSPPGSSVRGSSRQEPWSGLLCLFPGDLPNPGIDLRLLGLLHWPGGFFITSTTWEAPPDYLGWTQICCPMVFLRSLVLILFSEVETHGSHLSARWHP